MQRSTNRILTTHAGSLVRPKAILQAMKARALNQPIDNAGFDTSLREAVADVVREQVAMGVDIPGDGEFSRPGFSSYIWQRIEGLEPRALNSSDEVWGLRPETEADSFPNFYKRYNDQYRTWWAHPDVPIDELANVPGNFERFKATGPIKYRGHSVIERDLTNLKDALEGQAVAGAFITALGRVGHRQGVQSEDYRDFYPNEEAYRFAVADAFHEEYKAIIDAGFLLQVDYPNMARFLWVQSEEVREAGARSVDISIEALNYALRDIPEEQVRFHYCWGSGNTPHTSDPPLREVLPLILKVRAQAYSIEGANPRHEHEWMVWKDIKLPQGKILIPGVISHQTNVVEHPELVAWRIENFADVVGKENVIAGTDCGFSQNWDAIRVHPEIQWAKLESLAQGAAIASKKLWR